MRLYLLLCCSPRNGVDGDSLETSNAGRHFDKFDVV